MVLDGFAAENHITGTTGWLKKTTLSDFLKVLFRFYGCLSAL